MTHKNLVVTTRHDLSLSNFEDFDVMYYDNVDTTSRIYETVYFRDPFVDDSIQPAQVAAIIDKIFRICPNIISIDNVRTYDDMLIEDKWGQYRLLGRFMPETRIAKETSVLRGMIVKKRISSRSRAIYFEGDTLPGKPYEYIEQPLLNLVVEYRVYICKGQVLPQAITRQSKTKNSKTKALTAIQMDDDITKFANNVASCLPDMDLIGLDIARTVEGGLVLLEVNRAPQFIRYNELTGTNLVKHLFNQ